MQKDGTPIPWTMQVVIGSVLLAVVVGADVLDVINNYTFGATYHHGLAVAMVLAAVCVTLIPLAASIYGWTVPLRMLSLTCLAMTCLAAWSSYSSSFEDLFSKKSLAATKYTDAREDVKVARATLSRITETADSAALRTLTASLAQRLEGERLRAADAIGGTTKEQACSMRTACRLAQSEHTAALKRLADAEARDLAKAELATASSAASNVGSDVQQASKATALATAILTVLGIAVTQGIAIHGYLAIKMIRDGLARRVELKPILITTPTETAVTPRVTKDIALERLLKLIGSDGTQLVSKRDLARKVGAARASFNGWFDEWIDDNKIVVIGEGKSAIVKRAQVRAVIKARG